MTSKKEKTQKPATTSVTGEDKTLAAISYIWILWIVPFVAGNKKAFVTQHAKQGLLLFICEIVAWGLSVIPVIGWLLLGPIAWILCAIMAVMGIVKAVNGEEWQIPYIGHLADKIIKK